MTRARALLAAALSGLGAGCYRYVRVQEPDPVADLDAAVTIENVSRLGKGPDGTPVAEVGIRVMAPATIRVVVPPDPVIAYGPDGGTVRSGPVGTTGDSLRVAAGGKSRAVARLALPAIRTGDRLMLRLRWLEAAATGAPRERVREFGVRVVQVNYTTAVALGLGTAAAVVWVGGTGK